MALTPVVDAVLMAALGMPVPVLMTLSAAVAAAWLVAGAQLLQLNRPRLAWLPAVLVWAWIGLPCPLWANCAHPARLSRSER